MTGPAWIVLPARVIALVVVVPLRLCFDLLRLVGRGVAAVLRGIGLGVVWLFGFLIVRPLWWLVVAVVFRALLFLGRGTGRLARWLYSYLLLPIGRFLAMIGRGLGLVLDFVLLRPLRAIGRGLAWIGRGLAWIGAGIATVLGRLIAVLIVLPAVFVWRYVLRPPLAGLAWLALTVGRGIGSFFVAVGRVLSGGWGAFASAMVWAWRVLGRVLAWLGYVLFVLPVRYLLILPARYLLVLPARALYRYVLTPIGHGVAGTWRLAARILRWLWRTLVADPLRWVRTSVLRPIGNGVRTVWRVSVGDPVRAVRATTRETGREIRLTLRRVFRGR